MLLKTSSLSLSFYLPISQSRPCYFCAWKINTSINLIFARVIVRDRHTSWTFQYDVSLVSLRQPRTILFDSDSPTPMSGTSSIGSIDHSHHPSPLHSFIPGLKPSFSANPSHRSLVFSFYDWLHEFRETVYRYFWAYPFFLLFSFTFPHFLIVGFVR